MCPAKNLLKWHDMPPHLQFNPYIHTGYRPLLTFWESLASLFYLHNETINIVTHGVPIVFILVVTPRVMPWTQIDSHFLAWCHISGSVAPWIGSFIYHLFMNIKQPPSFYHRLLQLDMLGIWVSQSFGALPMVVASVFCLPKLLQWLIISCYCLFAIVGLFKALSASSPWNRRLCFALPFLMRNLLCVLRLTKYGGGDPSSISYVILQDLLSVVGGAIGAVNIPEKWFPGYLDLYLNSHNIMHVLVVSAVYCMFYSATSDLVWMAHGSCDRLISSQYHRDILIKNEL
ncbi:progestin and adipoQ receptor family member 4 [Rhodnius prolixus]|uniref:progestin and adipoQ receptor family member 4 n=1 Tax=Rhodnius prolixus TaxID=13249 RepID=UPI003D18AAD3